MCLARLAARFHKQPRKRVGGQAATAMLMDKLVGLYLSIYISWTGKMYRGYWLPGLPGLPRNVVRGLGVLSVWLGIY